MMYPTSRITESKEKMGTTLICTLSCFLCSSLFLAAPANSLAQTSIDIYKTLLGSGGNTTSGNSFSKTAQSVVGRELSTATGKERRTAGHQAQGAYERWDDLNRSSRVNPQMNFLPTTSSTTGTNNNTNSSGFNEATFPQLTRTAQWGYADAVKETDSDKLKYTESGTERYATYEHKEVTSRTMPYMNLAVDDEIFKAQMMYFQPIIGKNGMLEKFTNSKGPLDSFIGLTNSVVGIGNMSLGFLDKSVSSSTANTQMMAYMDVLAHLMKQVSYNTHRMANPRTDTVFEMADEKFEYCMFQRSSTGGSSSVPDNFNLAHVNIDSCESNCVPSGKSKDDIPPYQYCTCCADTVTTPNDSISGEATSSGGSSLSTRLKNRMCKEYLDQLKSSGGPSYQDDHTYSLVEKAFLGVKADVKTLNISNTNNNSSDDVYRLARQYAYNFQDLYGDYCMYQLEENGPLKWAYVPPLLSVQQQILFVRNGGDAQKMIRSSSGTGSSSNLYCSEAVGIMDHCPEGGSGTVPGICPTFRAFLDLVRDNKYEDARKDNADTVNNYWNLATVGGTLTINDFVHVKNLGDPPHYISPYQDRWVETYCDAAATTTFKRIHARMSSITNDYMTWNHRLTDKEKGMIISMMNRPLEQLNLALRESQSNLNLTIAAAQESSRKSEASRGSAMSSSRALYNVAQQMGEIKDFGR